MTLFSQEWKHLHKLFLAPSLVYSGFLILPLNTLPLSLSNITRARREWRRPPRAEATTTTSHRQKKRNQIFKCDESSRANFEALQKANRRARGWIDYPLRHYATVSVTLRCVIVEHPPSDSLSQLPVWIDNYTASFICCRFVISFLFFPFFLSSSHVPNSVWVSVVQHYVTHDQAALSLSFFSLLIQGPLKYFYVSKRRPQKTQENPFVMSLTVQFIMDRAPDYYKSARLL